MTRRRIRHRLVFTKAGRCVRVVEIRRVPFLLPWESAPAAPLWSTEHLALFATAAKN